MKPSGRDREAFFFAAYEILAKQGYRAVTVQSLCDHLGVTKGSFYHHFTDIDAFVGGFAEAWEGWVVQRILTYSAERDPRRRFEAITNGHMALLIGAEPAIRAWAHTRPELTAAVVGVHRVGEKLGEATVGEIVGDRELGVVLGQLIVAVAIGLQQRPEPISAARFAAVSVECFRRCLQVGIDLTETPGNVGIRLHPAATDQRMIRQIVPPVVRPECQCRPSPRSVRPAARSPQSRGQATFLAAARELLTEFGPDGVTIATLCAKLCVTKGSFQHQFTDMPTFMRILAEDYSTDAAERLEACEHICDPLARLAALLQLQAEIADPSIPAWRAWGWAEPRVMESIRESDERTQHAMRRTLDVFFADEKIAGLLAESTAALGIGLSYRVPMLSVPRRRRIVAEWAGRCLGFHVRVAPQQPDWLHLMVS